MAKPNKEVSIDNLHRYFRDCAVCQFMARGPCGRQYKQWFFQCMPGTIDGFKTKQEVDNCCKLQQETTECIQRYSPDVETVDGDAIIAEPRDLNRSLKPNETANVHDYSALSLIQFNRIFRHEKGLEKLHSFNFNNWRLDQTHVDAAKARYMEHMKQIHMAKDR